MSHSKQQRASYEKKDGQQQKLPDKPTDFQVRVHVLEARKLVGSNPNPTVKVACGRHIQQTSTQKGTNNPVFDEVSMYSKTEIAAKKYHRLGGLLTLIEFHHHTNVEIKHEENNVSVWGRDHDHQ